MCLLTVSISSLHLLGQEANLPGLYHHPELCWWGKCLRGTEKLIKLNLAFTFSTWCLRSHCREGRGNGWTNCPLLIISLCLRCLFVQWREWSEEGLAQLPWSSQWAAPCGTTVWTTLQEGCRASLTVSLYCWGISEKRERKQEHRGWCRQPSAPLCPQIIHTSYLVSSNSDKQPHFTFSFCALNVNLIIRIVCYRQAQWIFFFGLNYVATDQGGKTLIPRQDLKNTWKEATNWGCCLSVLYFPKSKTCITAFLARVVCL